VSVKAIIYHQLYPSTEQPSAYPTLPPQK